ncbi:hypothetical protein HF283_13175 [Acidithiobacillus ferrooxidans]|nr:hypothetical protein [Acidithiobacillus ferrooxidans]
MADTLLTLVTQIAVSVIRVVEKRVTPILEHFIRMVGWLLNNPRIQANIGIMESGFKTAVPEIQVFCHIQETSVAADQDPGAMNFVVGKYYQIVGIGHHPVQVKNIRSALHNEFGEFFIGNRNTMAYPVPDRAWIATSQHVDLYHDGRGGAAIGLTDVIDEISFRVYAA